MILTHGANSLRLSPPEPIPDFLFYTDFSGYDKSTRIDTPLIGGICEYNASIYQTYHGAGGPFGKKYGEMYSTYSFPAPTQRYTTIVTSHVPSALTSEIWIKSYSDASGYFGLGWRHQLLTLDFKLVPLLNIRDVDNAVVSFYNGASRHSASSGRNLYVSTNVSAQSVWRHVAIVDTTTDTYLYVDGTLYCTITNQSPIKLIISGYAIPLTGTGSSATSLIGYWSFRVGDYASSNHQVFPVPTAPYDPSVIVQ